MISGTALSTSAMPRWVQSDEKKPVLGVHLHDVLIAGDRSKAAVEAVFLPVHRVVAAQALEVMAHGVVLKQPGLADIDRVKRQRKGLVAGEAVSLGVSALRPALPSPLVGPAACLGRACPEPSPEPAP